MTPWRALILACRPLNLLIMAYTLAAMIYGVMWPGLEVYGLHSAPMLHVSALIIVSIILLAAAGNLINDFFDVDVDEYNGDRDNQVGKAMTYRFTLSWYWILTASGVILGGILAYLFKSPMLVFIHLFIAGSLWIYSWTWQTHYLMGNVVIGILTAFLPFIALTYASHGLFYLEGGYLVSTFKMARPVDFGAVIAVYCLFAFLTTLLREFVKDVQDMPGDSKSGYRTLAIVRGEQSTVRICIAVSILLIVLSLGFCYYSSTILSPVSLWAFLLALIPLEVYLLVTLIQGKKRPDYLEQASGLLKLIMVSGVTTAWFFVLF